MDRLISAARRFWHIPDTVGIMAAPGASVLIAQLPGLRAAGRVVIPAPTYNEHAAAFQNHGWQVASDGPAQAQVVVHPNNPDGHIWTRNTLPVEAADLTIIDESFCDVSPHVSMIGKATEPGTIILKSFGKFWGLAGLRLGFAIGDPTIISALKNNIGPWSVAGPALCIGARALEDTAWASQTRLRLKAGSDRLDQLMIAKGAKLQGGTSLFRLYDVDDAAQWQDRLARHRIWTRIFPYNARWLRLGIPAAVHWPRVRAALT